MCLLREGRCLIWLGRGKEFLTARRPRACLQVLDARDPLACRCPDVERYIRQTNPNKKIILLLNKMGACDSMMRCRGSEA